jgi:transcription antitermination factor NusG
MSPYWAAARIRNSDRKQVLWRIERQGFETYLPLCRPSRRSTKVVPLFIGYVFVRIENVWRCLLGTHGVIGLIRAGDAPAVVREDEIERIRAAETRDKHREEYADAVARRHALVDASAVGHRAAQDAHAFARLVPRPGQYDHAVEREIAVELREADVTAA